MFFLVELLRCEIVVVEFVIVVVEVEFVVVYLIDICQRFLWHIFGILAFLKLGRRHSIRSKRRLLMVQLIRPRS